MVVKDDNLYVAIGPTGVDFDERQMDRPEVEVTRCRQKYRLLPLIH